MQFRRHTPRAIWRIALIPSKRHYDTNRNASFRPPPPPTPPSIVPHRNGVRASRQVQRSSVALHRRRTRLFHLASTRTVWPNAQQTHIDRAHSVDAGPDGSIGLPIRSAMGRYPGASTRSLGNSPDGADFARNFAWAGSHRSRLSSGSLTPYRDTCGWKRQWSEFPYNRIWYAANSFIVGLYGFHFQPFLRTYT